MARLTKKAHAQLTEHLAAQPTDRLVELLMEQVEGDPALKERLLLEMAGDGGTLDPAPFRRSIASALRVSGTARRYPRTSGRWFRDVREAIAPLHQLLASGREDVVVELCEYALGRVDVEMSRIDDSSGYFREIVAELEGLHHDGCVASRPDPVALARRLVDIEIGTSWDILIDSAARYADVLGPDGLAEMRRLAEERAAEMPKAGPDGREPTGAFHLQRMREKLARQAGDVDSQVALMAQDLSYPLHYAHIAEALAEAGRVDDALAWAERGIATFDASDHHLRGDPRLDDAALAAYLELGRPEDAVALVWRRFDEQPGLGSWQRLADWTGRLDRWEELRPQAAARLEEDARARADGADAPARGWRSPPYENLIAVLLSEGDVDTAWSTAAEHGCTQGLWLRLAQVRAADHPLDAVPVYDREVAQHLTSTRKRRYEDAVAVVAHIRDLYSRAGDPDGFARYLADLRAEHRAKTKLLALLDAAGLAN